MEKIMESRNLKKYFGQAEGRVTALDGVAVDIYEGEFVSIMGPSGSGKSTLLFALSGMDGIDEGEVLFQNQSLERMTEEQMADLRRTQMGFVFQEPTMLKNLDILDNIILPAYEEKQKEEIIERAKRQMLRMGIEGLESRNITEVSGGQLQRASICRAILHSPSILFGDEPTGALNSKTADEIMQLFQELNRDGMTILLVTHDYKVAAKTNRVLFMKDGKIESEIQFTDEITEKRIAQINRKMLELEI